MGPGPDGPGKRILLGVVIGIAFLLQWGRGRMAPENGVLEQLNVRMDELQWGRGRMAPENAYRSNT